MAGSSAFTSTTSRLHQSPPLPLRADPATNTTDNKRQCRWLVFGQVQSFLVCLFVAAHPRHHKSTYRRLEHHKPTGSAEPIREFLEVEQWTQDGPAVQTMITLLISEGLLSKVLKKTRLYSQVEEYQLNTNTAALLLTLSLRAHTTDARIRMELSRAIHILSGGGTGQIQDLLTGWLEDALLRLPWIWPTVTKARTIPLLMTRMEFTCHALQNKPSNLLFGLRATDVLCHLCQDPSYYSDVLNSGNHLLLQTDYNARLMQMVRPDKEDLIGSLAQDIQFAIMECVKLMTVPRPQADPPHGTLRMCKISNPFMFEPSSGQSQREARGVYLSGAGINLILLRLSAPKISAMNPIVLKKIQLRCKVCGTRFLALCQDYSTLSWPLFFPSPGARNFQAWWIFGVWFVMPPNC